MSFQFELTKATETLQFELVKHDVQQIIPCQVHVAMDVSGSFWDEHQNGYTQQLLNRFVPFSMLFDKDQVLDSYAYGSQAKVLPQITKDNYATYIRKHMPINGVNGCSTNYAAAFELMADEVQDTQTSFQDVVVQKTKQATGFLGRLFGKQEVISETQKQAVTTTVPSADKHLFFFVTDGQPDSERAAAEALKKLHLDNVFIVFISISSRPVRFLETFAAAPHSVYINYTPAELRNLQNVSDTELYKQLLASNQLVAWMKK